jgi:hypothetical protein
MRPSFVTEVLTEVQTLHLAVDEPYPVECK